MTTHLPVTFCGWGERYLDSCADAAYLDSCAEAAGGPPPPICISILKNEKLKKVKPRIERLATVNLFRIRTPLRQRLKELRLARALPAGHVVGATEIYACQAWVSMIGRRVLGERTIRGREED